ncbi:probable G-protein coupled receptor 139 [Physella acuta]|uniref:probable G-protein coupled receptor 139 n=1 Tax=Physella acuta TaxID=109671 RepID=UPI0027DB8BB6|nr:probable G-protein coupled receptor 139 [Physella acuta]XP_059177340.1 probable G-protein coupled receptor 139 [Physella acuta]XP_059177341.1 probable G-protein coupled receptor 139 [Physella acuta]XP_059177342.1 probable G-protein coupled receptor 139 [Physella acuta]XP_059177343.1 probable G-protein coupled receptor 139 [Physella acuta]XP_059177344.1 probable G-protein coupled receptor 139 [Physella acuta]
MADLNITSDIASSILTNTTQILTITGEDGDWTVATRFHYVMSAIIGPILCILGLVGNILSIIVWCRPGMVSSTARYLTGMAGADIGVLVMFLLCDSLQAWYPDVIYSPSYGVFFSYIGYPMLFFTVVLSVWIIVGVTVDRYIMVCWITSAKKYCNERRANLGLFLITINSFIVNAPHFGYFKHVDNSQEDNSTDTKPRPSFEKTRFGAGEGGDFYEFWIHCIILILIPWFSVLFMNIKIIMKITESNRRMSGKKTRESMKKCKQSENQITRLLLTVTFAFLIFIGMQCIIQCFQMQQPEWADKAKLSSAFAFAKVGIVFNSALNFLFYCFSGRRFRMELLKLLGLVDKDAQLSSLVDHTSSSMSSARSTSSTGI